MTDMMKLKRTAMVLVCIVGLVMLYLLTHITLMIRSSASLSMIPTPTAIIVFAVSWSIVLAAMGISLSMLLVIKRGETPFSMAFVKRLKALALLIIVYEPVVLIGARLIRFEFPAFEGYIDGVYTMITTTTGFVGIIMVAGLIVYCVAHILNYGISLQEQVDETL